MVAKDLNQLVKIHFYALRVKGNLKELFNMAPALKLVLCMRILNTSLAAIMIFPSNDVALSPGPFDLRVSSQGRHT